MGITSGWFMVLRNISEPNRSAGRCQADACTYMSYREGMSAYGLARRTIFTSVTSTSSYSCALGRELAASSVLLLSAQEASSRATISPPDIEATDDWLGDISGPDFSESEANSIFGDDMRSRCAGSCPSVRRVREGLEANEGDPSGNGPGFSSRTGVPFGVGRFERGLVVPVRSTSSLFFLGWRDSVSSCASICTKRRARSFRRRSSSLPELESGFLDAIK